MKVKLIYKKQNEILGTYTLGLDPFTIGRDPQNSLVIDEPHISRTHAKLEWKENKLCLTRISTAGKLIFDGKNTEYEELSLEFGGGPGHHQKTLSFEIPPYSFTVSVETPEEEVPAEPPFPFMMNEELPEEGDKIEKLAEETKITARPIKAKLIVLQGLSPHTSYDLVGNEIILGRDSECDVPLEDSKVSRDHAHIYVKNHTYILKDSGSTNGTFLNHNPVETDTPLSSSDQIQLGDCVLQFALVDEAFELIPASVLSPDATQAGTLSPTWEPETPSYILRQPGAPFLRVLKQKKIFFAFGSLLLLLGLFLLIEQKPKPSKERTIAEESKTKREPQKTDELAGLTQVDQEYVLAKMQEAKDYYKNRQYEKAQVVVQEALRIAPTYKPALDLNAIIRQTFEDQSLETQRREAQREEKKLEEEIQYHLSVALDYFNRQQWEKALEEYDKILELQPDLEEAQKRRQIVQEKLSRKAPASEEKPTGPKEIVKKPPSQNKQAEKFLAQGSKLSQEGKMKEALETWRKVLRLEGLNPQYYAKAEQFITFTKEQMEQKYLPLLSQAKVLMESKEYLKAKEILDGILKEYPTHPEAQASLERVLFALHGLAKKEYTEAIIDENVGRVDAAKEKFKWIVDRIPATDEYHQKAKNKLKKYE